MAESSLLVISERSSLSSPLETATAAGAGARTPFWRVNPDSQDIIDGSSSSSTQQADTFCQRPPKLLLQVCNDLRKCRGDSYHHIIIDDGDDDDDDEQLDHSSSSKKKKKKSKKRKKNEKVKSLVEEYRRRSRIIPFNKRKLKLQNINLGPEDVPINELMGTPLGDSLSKLSLSCNNHLSDIPPGLVLCLPALTSLDLSRCKLKELPKQWDLPKLKRLNLSDNLISDFLQEVSVRCSDNTKPI